MTQPPDADWGPPTQPPVQPEVPGRVHLPTVTAFPYVPSNVAPPTAPTVPVPPPAPPVTSFPPVAGAVPPPPAPPPIPYPSFGQLPPPPGPMYAAPAYAWQVAAPAPKKSKAVPILIGVIIFGLVLVLAGVASMFVHAAHVRASKAPISTGSLSDSGKTVVTSKGITVTLPARYQNVPTTPEKLQQFVDEKAKLYPSIRRLVTPTVVSRMAILAMSFDHAGHVSATFDAAPTRDPSDAQGMLRQVPVMTASLHGEHVHSQINHVANRDVVDVWFSVPPNFLNRQTTYLHMLLIPASNGAIVMAVSATNAGVAATDIFEIAQTLQIS